MRDGRTDEQTTTSEDRATQLEALSLAKMFGLYGLKHHTVEINGNVTIEDTHTYIQTYM